ncbi:MAG: hypothetical protein O7D86_10825, partial [Proteobacteria bacterium]|nr:hypothetical protein [Pseudomonadota bacterium]
MKTKPIQLRSAPPVILTAGLLLWGWQTMFLPYALIMAVMLETSYWVSWRWHITNKEFNDIADLIGIVFFIVVIYIFVTEGANGIFVILSILPFILFLLVLVQLYSEAG